MNMTTVPSNQLKAIQHEIADLKEQVALYAGIDDEKACIAHLLDRANETIAQQAEAIRVKDAALDWCIGEFNLRLDDIDLSQETISVLSARHIQPSPEHLEAWYKSMVGEPVAYMQISVEEGVDTKFPRDHLPKKYNKEWWKFEPLHAIKPFPFKGE